MKYTLIVLALLFLGSACTENKKSVKEIHAYFDLDSLLDEQAYTLFDRGLSVTKQVTLNGEEESKTFTPDTTSWTDEFSIMRDFNLNKPYYVGQIKQKSGEEKKQYLPQNEDIPVKSFDLFYDEGTLIRIEALLEESKYVFTSKRKLTLVFRDGLLESYEVDGKQKMILQEEEDYVIKGSINIK